MTKTNWKLFVLVTLKLILSLLAGLFGFITGAALAVYFVYKEYSSLYAFFGFLIAEIFVIYNLKKIKLEGRIWD